ncbi:hypothetical protein CAP35_05140 [Chitinophagaceae bacterium IBVUCB1]|nr:hypothetical protein CAP35_05140 [Chitinophagaceae bacterium IBVUCB1]
MDKKNIKEELARRAELSLVGKAIIGIVGGVMLLLLGLRTCSKREDIQLDTSNVKWLSQSILDLAITLDSSKKAAHLIKFGVDAKIADSIATLICTRNKGGVIIRELDSQEIDSLNNANNFPVSIPDNTYNVFYVQSLKDDDYVIVIKDSLIKDIISR